MLLKAETMIFSSKVILFGLSLSLSLILKFVLTEAQKESVNPVLSALYPRWDNSQPNSSALDEIKIN